VRCAPRGEVVGETPSVMPRPRSQLLARSLVALPAAALLALAAGACGGDEDGSVAAGAGDTPADGAAVYARACASCHGDDLRGTDKGPSHLSQVYEPGHHPDAAFRAAIVNGSPEHHWSFGDMAPVTGLSEAEVDAVIAFIRAQQEEQGFEPYPPS
jgi:mono/diheme cytochrome c family protein